MSQRRIARYAPGIGWAPFAWQLAGLCEAVAISNPQFPSGSCCTLPLTDGDSLGNRDLEAGETYDLVVESEGARIEGRTRIPSAFSVQVVQEESRDLAVWSTSDGAGGYAVTNGNHDVVLTTDTTLVLPADPAERFVHVEAVDENLYRYLSDDLTRSGIDTDEGVFGAMWSPGIVAY